MKQSAARGGSGRKEGTARNKQVINFSSGQKKNMINFPTITPYTQETQIDTSKAYATRSPNLKFVQQLNQEAENNAKSHPSSTVSSQPMNILPCSYIQYICISQKRFTPASLPKRFSAYLSCRRRHQITNQAIVPLFFFLLCFSSYLSSLWPARLTHSPSPPRFCRPSSHFLEDCESTTCLAGPRASG